MLVVDVHPGVPLRSPRARQPHHPDDELVARERARAGPRAPRPAAAAPRVPRCPAPEPGMDCSRSLPTRARTSRSGRRRLRGLRLAPAGAAGERADGESKTASPRLTRPPEIGQDGVRPAAPLHEGGRDPEVEEVAVVPVVALARVRRLDRTQLVEERLRVAARYCSTCADQHVPWGTRPPTKIPLQLEPRPVAGDDLGQPGVEHRPALPGSEAVELLVRPPRPGATSRPGREPVAHEPREDGVELAPRRRPHVRDRTADPLRQLVAGALAAEREEREHGGLARRQRCAVAGGVVTTTPTVSVLIGLVQSGLNHAVSSRLARR